MTARAYDPATMLTTIIQNQSDASEKLSLNGTEAYYIDLGMVSQETFQMKHRLGWMDEVNHLYYEIYDSVDSQLSRQELVSIATNVLVEQHTDR